MEDWQIPLIGATAAFAAFLLWQARPAFFALEARTMGRLAKEAQKRAEDAPNDQLRALALCDAGDEVARHLGGGASAAGFFLRAMRTDPTSAEIVNRASLALARRPRALESLLWRKLSADPWTGPARPAVVAALRHLAGIYMGARRSAVRAKAIEHALHALGEPPAAKSTPPPPLPHPSSPRDQ